VVDGAVDEGSRESIDRDDKGEEEEEGLGERHGKL
jgi:hypothetical protein